MKRTFNLFSLAMVLALGASLVGLPSIPVYSQSMLEHVPLSLPTGWSNGYLYDVWGSSASDVYAVGHANNANGDHVPLMYHNDGTGWTEASPPLLAGWYTAHLYGVWGSGTGDLYVVGEGYGTSGVPPLLYYYDGAAWIDPGLSLPAGWTSGYLIDVWGSGTGDIYAVGWGSRGDLIYHNDGTGWTDISASLPAGGGGLHSVWGSSADDVYVAGGSNVYHNNGTGWTDVSPSLPAGWNFGDLYGVGGSSASDIYTVGPGGNGALIYHNDVAGWIYTSPSLPAGWGDGYLHNIWGSTASNVYAVGYKYSGGFTPLLYYNNGTSWTDVSPSLPAEWSAGYLHSVWGSGAGHLYMVGEGFNSDHETSPLLYQRNAVLVVTNTNDSGAGSLRQAIAEAAAGDTITFHPNLAGQTITLSSNLIINKDLTIDGSGLAPQVAIYGGNIAHLEVTTYHVVTISELTIANGYTSGSGGAILSNGDLTIVNSTLRNNYAIGNGGAVYSAGRLSLENSTLEQNQAGGGGGALSIVGNNTFCCNIIDSTFAQNQAQGGGAISIEGNVVGTIVNSTFFQNQAVESGGAIYMRGNVSLEVFNSTFAVNDAAQDSEVYNIGNGLLSLYNTILLCKPGNSSCISEVITLGISTVHSLIGVGTPADFGLAELADNGGPTQTMALLPGSPLIDAGDDANCPDTDQRGVARPQGAHCDIGAFEAPPVPEPPVAATLVSPTGSIFVKQPAYAWNNVTDATWYYLWVSKVNSNGTLTTVHTKWYSADLACSDDGCSVAPDVTLTAGDYRWWIRTWNETGYGPWSAGMNFTASAPGAATLVSPSGDIGTTYTPAYTWNEVAGASWYYLWVNGPNGNVMKKWYEASLVCDAGTCSVTPAITLAGGAHKFWVQTWNEVGYGPWSSAMDFIVTPLGAATLVSPDGPIPNTMPEYTWNNVTGATWYQLWVSRVNSNGSLTTVHAKWNEASQVCSGATCSFTPDVTLTSGNYRWWVRTWNAAGYGPWSSAMNFSVAP